MREKLCYWAVVCVATTAVRSTVALADNFTGTRDYTIRLDTNAGDGAQVEEGVIPGTITTGDSVNYILDFGPVVGETPPTDPNPLLLERSGQWLNLTTPQLFDVVPGEETTMTGLHLASDGSGGVLVFTNKETQVGADPTDISTGYSVWSDRTDPVDIADLLGVWQMQHWGNDNVISDTFFMETWNFTVTSPEANKITINGAPGGPITFTLSGIELIPDDPTEFFDARFLITDFGLVYGEIDVEENFPTDISITGGIATLVPEPTSVALLGLVSLAIVRRRG